MLPLSSNSPPFASKIIKNVSSTIGLEDVCDEIFSLVGELFVWLNPLLFVHDVKKINTNNKIK